MCCVVVCWCRDCCCVLLLRRVVVFVDDCGIDCVGDCPDVDLLCVYVVVLLNRLSLLCVCTVGLYVCCWLVV